MVTITVAGFLTDFTGGQRQIAIDNATVLSEALASLWRRHVGLRDRVVNEQGQIRQHVNIFLNNENVRRLKVLESELKDGDEITILPSVSGGAV